MAQTTAPEDIELAERRPGSPAGHFRDGRHQPRRAPSVAFGPLASTLAGEPATAGVALVAAVLTWRWQAWVPVRAGLSSWQAGLTLAFLHHLQWGHQVVFTFGPYGFLEDVLPFGRTTAGLALAYSFVLRYGLATLVVCSLRKSWGLFPAGAGAWLAVGTAANLAEAPALASVVSLGLALRALGAHERGDGQLGPGPLGTSQRRRLLVRPAMLALLGGLAGLQLLVEVNSGLVSTGLALVAASFGRGRRALADLALTIGALAGVALAALAAAGQSFTDLPSYLRGEMAVALGYTPAMSLSSGRTAEDLFALVELCLLAVVFTLVLRGAHWQTRLAAFLCLAGWAWELAKEGFVRHDLHDLTFFGLLVAAVVLARLPRGLRGLQAGALAVTATLACLANGGPPISLRSPVESVGSIATEVADLTSAQRWAAVETVAKRQAARTGDALPGRLLNALATHSFAVEPLEDSMSFAYPALRRWAPEPVLQAYSAYTPYLDHLDSAFLASRQAPQLILYRPVPTNNFDPAWEPPAGTEALYCHYAEVTTADYWVLLRRVPGRCGRPVALGQVTAHFGQRVSVPAAPAPADMVIARFSLRLPAGTGIENALWKAPAVYAKTWGAPARGTSRRTAQLPGAGTSTWRFVPATAGEDHVMYAPPALGWAAGYGPAPVWQFELSGGGWQNGQGTVRAQFFAVPLRAVPA